ncbi:MAG: trans-aconitate 2-methyltransferase [Alphaproteobacteria bacterium]
MRKTGWSPEQYLKFEDERTRPAKDLLSAVPNGDVEFAVDLGCGPGNSTGLLAQRYPAADILGVDSSQEMIVQARERLPTCRFEQGDLASWYPERDADVLYSNAAMQWLGDHDGLFPRLMQCLRVGGSLAIQMPDNLDEPAHVAMREAASDARWAERFSRANAARSAIGTPASYYALLKSHGRRVDIWRTAYQHPLQGVEGIAEWFKGSALRPYMAALDEAERRLFEEKYIQLLAQSYKPMEDGSVLLPFPRLFIVATR